MLRGKDWNLQELTGLVYGAGMAEPIESLERRIESLRTAVRKAAASGDRGRAGALRAELRQAEKAWDEALERL